MSRIEKLGREVSAFSKLALTPTPMEPSRRRYSPPSGDGLAAGARLALRTVGWDPAEPCSRGRLRVGCQVPDVAWLGLDELHDNKDPKKNPKSCEHEPRPQAVPVCHRSSLLALSLGEEHQLALLIP